MYSKKHKADSCFQLGMYCKVHLAPFGCSWMLGRAAKYLFIHWHLKVFLILLLPGWWVGLCRSPGADQTLFVPAWWLLMFILRQRSCWYQYQGQQWEVVTTPSSGKGRNKLWGVKFCALGAWGEHRCKAPQAGVSWALCIRLA